MISELPFRGFSVTEPTKRWSLSGACLARVQRLTGDEEEAFHIAGRYQRAAVLIPTTNVVFLFN
ncbi:MAG: hypothetical protein NTY51_03410 [Deltaproteobacteria bacterium]|nr:hypothetical protein [Deltaproteobacteria bacterium]